MCALRGRLAARCSGRLTLTKQAHAQLRLSAAVMLRALLRPPPPRREPDDADVDALPAKRRRVGTYPTLTSSECKRAPQCGRAGG